MRETTFLMKNADKWQGFEKLLDTRSTHPDTLSGLFVEITDDLAYAQTHYPQSRTVAYLNNLATKAHLLIYKNKREKSNRFKLFWFYELPLLFSSVHTTFLYSFLIFAISTLIGVVSTAYDETFVRLILGDDYVNMTLQNIRNNDPMAVYKSPEKVEMFLGITINNVLVSFKAFYMGLLLSFGTVYVLFINGVMVGTFQYFFYEHNLLITSMLTIWIHGTLEISAIIIAGGAGMVMGNSILFPQTYTRLESFKRGAKKGVKIIIGLVPIFIVAGFLESFVTPLTGMPDFLKLLLILTSAGFILYYFVIYPIQLQKTGKVLDID